VKLRARRARETEGLATRASRATLEFLNWLWIEVVEFAKANPFVTAVAVFGLVRACGATVSTGQTGLLFTFGRVRRRLEPGFHPLVPFVQFARIVPTRARTFELGEQRVVTSDGLVFHVRANLVWRIEEIEKALIEVDDLERGMRNVLAISVQRTLAGMSRNELHRSPELDELLRAAMQEQLAAWGVVVVRAGFATIAPSPRSLRVTQLRERVAARRTGFDALRMRELGEATSVALLGTRVFPRRRALGARRREHDRRRSKRHARERERILRDGAPDPKRAAKKPATKDARTSSARTNRAEQEAHGD